MSEDLSEGEKGDVVSDISSHGDVKKSRLPRISSTDIIETWTGHLSDKKLYIVLIRRVLQILDIFSAYVICRVLFV